MLSEEQAAKNQQVIGLSTVQKICRMLGHDPDRTISVNIDACYVHVSFMTADDKRVTESIEVVRGR